MNLDQTTSKNDETWGIASPLPREHIPKSSHPKDQLILRIRGEIKRDWGFLKHSRTSNQKARDSRGFRTWLEARESQQRTRSLLAIKCAKNEVENPSHKGTKRGDGIDLKSPEGTRRLGPPFPIKSTQGFINPSTKSILKRRTEGEEHRGGGLGERTIHGRVTKAAINLTQVKGYLYPRDWSDRYAGPVRPVGLQHPLYMISSDG